MKYYTIYQTINLINGKIYIGMHETDNLEDNYLGSGKRLKRSIRYYGKENFKKEILFIFDNREEMIQKEIELITEEFVNRKDTYNLMKGGEGGWDLKRSLKGANVFKEKIKKDKNFRNSFVNKVKESHKLRKSKGENYNWLNWTGKKHSSESKSKIGKSNSIKQKGNKNSQFGTCWITNEKENKKISKGDSIPNGWRLGRKINLFK